MNDDDSNTTNVFEIQNSFSLSLSLSTDSRDWCSFASSVDGTRARVGKGRKERKKERRLFFFVFFLYVVFDDSKSPTDTSSQRRPRSPKRKNVFFVWAYRSSRRGALRGIVGGVVHGL